MSVYGMFGPHGLFGGWSGSTINFDAKKDIPDLAGKVIAITGGTNGIGREIVKNLAAHNPAKIILLARTYRMARSTIAIIESQIPGANIVFIECNLARLETVKEAVEKLEAETSRLDMLFCNAGVFCTEPGVSKDGYENQFATNFLSHALLIRMMLPTLQRTTQDPYADVRIVFTGSQGHKWAPAEGIAFSSVKSKQENLSGWARYGQSKLAEILYVSELAQRYPKITSVAVHPGIVNTSLSLSLERRSFVFSTVKSLASSFSGLVGIVEPEVGCNNVLWGATATGSAIDSGKYYTPIGVSDMGTEQSKDSVLASKLWEWTEEVLAPHLA